MDEKHYQDYAKAICKEKGIKENQKNIAEIVKKLHKVFSIQYQAVAFDVDGTIKEDSEGIIDKEIIQLIGNIVLNGAYVLFVTGGGKTTVEGIFNQIKEDLSNEYNNLQKIYAIDGNGCRLFQFDKNLEIKTTRIGQRLYEIIGKDEYDKLLNTLQEKCGNKFTIQEKSCGIRLVSNEGFSEDDLENIFKDCYNNHCSEVIQYQVKHVSGKWEGRKTYDISQTDKDFALSWFYTQFDFFDVPILRIGDQGGPGGNDQTLLDSQYGFSVGISSNSILRCFPVFSFEEGRLLKGVEGTKYLLNQINWGQRMTIPSFLVSDKREEFLSKCLSLENESIAKTQVLVKWWEQQAEGKLPNDYINQSININFNNIFDHKSGAITFSDKEWDELENNNIVSFFKERYEDIDDNNFPKLKRALYRETGVITRGPNYYLGISEKIASEKQLEVLFDDILIMQNIILNEINSLDAEINPINWKLQLSLLDNFKNHCIILYTMIYQAASLYSNSKEFWKRLLIPFEDYLASSIGLYYSTLCFFDIKYKNSISDLRKSIKSLYQIKNMSHILYDFLLKNGEKQEKIIRKWRELDHSGQILCSIYSIKEDLEKISHENSKIAFIGLMYGGIELPFVSRFFYNDLFPDGIKLGLLGGISFYRRKNGSLIMDQYSDEVLESSIPNKDKLDDLLTPGDPAIIFDDNIMTGRTLELAKNRLNAHGIQVPFCVCVKYPYINRINQMAMIRHGGINPNALGKEIKGLMAKSPYSRIFTSDKGYEDALGIFDLSRNRIKNYLKKNGNKISED